MHQRELHSDTHSFAQALRAALRQAPKVILVGEMRDRETIEIALEAAETGHLVMSTLHTIDASKPSSASSEPSRSPNSTPFGNRLAKSFRYIVSQRLLPQERRKRPRRRHRNLKIHLAHPRVRGKRRARRQDASRRHARRRSDGMQHFDDEIES